MLSTNQTIYTLYAHKKTIPPYAMHKALIKYMKCGYIWLKEPNENNTKQLDASLQAH